MSSRKKRARKPPKKHIFKFTPIVVLTAIIGVLCLSVIGVYNLWQSWLVDLPSLEGIENYNTEGKTRFFASDRITLLAELYEFDRTPVTSNQVAPVVFDAIIAVEDERFWQHDGVDYYGVLRAVYIDMTTNVTQGASTIPMQLIRQTIMQDSANEMTLRRKVREAALAQQLEEKFTKEEILMMYLNTINFGDGSWGIQSAAQHYYSKDAADLTLVEAALLCGIPQSPEYNNPVVYPENARYRRNIVLERMYVNGYITEDEMDTAKLCDLGLNVKYRTVDGIYLAPYSTSYARHELFELLPYDVVLRGGLDVYTSIDLQYEQWANEACAARESLLPEGAEVSLTCVDPNSGYILCMRGGKDFYADQFNTCWQMRRSAGSSFKPFALVTLIEKGYSPLTNINCSSPLKIGNWDVKNYGGGSYGDMPIANATWYSYNTAYARIVRAIGPEAIADTAHRMGITSDLIAVNSIVLGSNGVCTMEMASAFGTLATGGIHYKPTTIVQVIDRDGKVIAEPVPIPTRVLTPEVAYATTSVLRGVVQRGTGTEAAFQGRDIAGKTGTSDDWTDAWFIGYTPQLVTAVWVGFRDSLTYINRNEGGLTCAPVWRTFMSNALDGVPSEEFAWAPAPAYRQKAETDFMTAEEAEIYKLKTTDSDKDGFSDWDEIQAGTDPYDPTDYPGKPPAVVNPGGDTGGGSGGSGGNPGGGPGNRPGIIPPGTEDPTTGKDPP
ncbi:MAG: transglycosylase domain-containing protein [Coriobacteriales bacterium]|jgi:penicillin-binding protein 1A|nr:transglycosylase domain-containing protein [Coriobacteriales bacterium]